MHNTSKVQATHVTYEWHTLGWKAFQDLCASVLGEVFGQNVQIFSSSNDGGRDGTFTGTWEPQKDKPLNGPTVIQCKFTNEATKRLNLSSLEEEFNKARILATKNMLQNYILISNYNLSGDSEEKIKNQYLSIPGIKHVEIYGSEWLTLRVRDSSKLRMMVPRVYGLGDLSLILDARAYAQANEILSWMREDIAKFVVTSAYKKSAKAINEHNFVLLLGEPASGKSVIAAHLALGAADRWKASAIKINSPEEFIKHRNPHETCQFFWCDDAFGTTQYQPDLADRWNKTFPYVFAAIQKGARCVFTSRDYIFNRAKLDLKTNSFPVLNLSQVVINVQEYKKDEKEQILYNHIKLGDQDKPFRSKIKSLLPDVVSSQHFLPEIARRLGNRLCTSQLAINREAVKRFVEQPLEFMENVIINLDSDNRAALTILFMFGGEIESPIDCNDDIENALKVLGSSIHAVTTALNALNNSIILTIRRDGKTIWKLKHPTIGDAIASVTAENPEQLDIYLKGAKRDQLMKEVVCGDVEREGAKVKIPPSRFDLMLDKVEEAHKSKKDDLYHFLSWRCDKQFLKMVFQRHPFWINELSNPISFLGANSRVAMLAKLHETGLLPENIRSEFVKNVKCLAVKTPDSDFLISRIRKIFTGDELTDILNEVKTKLLNNISAVIQEWKDGYSFSDPESSWTSFETALLDYKMEFNEPDINNIVDEAVETIRGIIEEMKEDKREKEERDYSLDGEAVRTTESGERSIFEDIDI